MDVKKELTKHVFCLGLVSDFTKLLRSVFAKFFGFYVFVFFNDLL